MNDGNKIFFTGAFSSKNVTDSFFKSELACFEFQFARKSQKIFSKQTFITKLIIMEFVAIKDLRDGMKNINVMFIVLEMTGATKTKEQREVFSFKVADSVSL